MSNLIRKIKIELRKPFLQKLELVSPSIQKQVYKRISLFKLDPFDSQLRNHALKGKYLGFRSIDITYDYRDLFRELENSVHFTYLDTHKELYGK